MLGQKNPFHFIDYIFLLYYGTRHGSFIIWFKIEGYYRQDLIFALNTRDGSDLLIAIQHTSAALKQTELICGRPYCKRAMPLTQGS